MPMEDEENEILNEQFAIYPGKIKYNVTLTNVRIRIEQIGQANRSKGEDIVMLNDVTGSHVLQGKAETSSSAYLCVYSYPLRKKKLGSGIVRQRVTKTFTIDCNNTYQENFLIAERWKMTIKRLITGEKIKTKEDIENGCLAARNLLVLVNPFSGRKKASAIYKEKVKPMFLEAEIKHSVQHTDYAGHAREMAKKIVLEDWDGIVIISGDGLVHEVINGLMDRPDWKKAIQMPIGIIPGGSGNALAAAVVYASTGLHNVATSPTLCTFEVCRGFVQPMDLVAVEMENSDGYRNRDFDCQEFRSNVCYSFLGIVLGLIADLDIESEALRCLGGELRATLYAIIRILFLRKYELEVSYLPCSDAPATNNIMTTSNEELQAAGDPGVTNSERALQGMQPLDKDVPHDWVKESDRYVMVMSNYITHLATDALVQRKCKFSDGKIYLNLSGCSTNRKDCLKAWGLMQDGLGVHDENDASKCSGKHVECTAFRVVPKGRSQCITVDGELLPFGSFQCSIMPGLARIMTSLPQK